MSVIRIVSFRPHLSVENRIRVITLRFIFYSIFYQTKNKRNALKCNMKSYKVMYIEKYI
jgi:hypothetical protein